MLLPALRQEVCDLLLELPRNNLVSWTSGNVSGRDPETGHVVIKPSGVRYRDMTPAKLVIVDHAGRIIEGFLKPSVDCPTHLYIYRSRPDVFGIVHTHSTFATAFAAVGQEIPAVLTAIADEFGGPIPIGGYAQIGEEEIGKTVVAEIGRSNAILLRNHGVFTIGPTPEAAVKAAVMVEDVARTVFFARQLGVPLAIAPDEIARAHARYVSRYGQRPSSE